MLARDTPDPLMNVEERDGGAPARAAARSVGASDRNAVSTLAREEAPLVELAGLAYTYEGERSPVLEGISFTVTSGEFVLILGPSGCGKSTLMQVMNGTVPHALRGRLEGSAVVCGREVASAKVTSFATEVGIVFQDPEAQIINIRVRDEVTFGLEISVARSMKSSPVRPRR